MAKDNRTVNYAIRQNGQILVDEDVIAGEFSQSELDSFIERSVLSGDWKSTKPEAKKDK